MSGREVHVSAAVVVDAAGRALVVRKRGTTVFMQPGGKPERDETPAITCARELREETGLDIPVDELHPLGVFRAAAANEPGFTVVAHAFSVIVDAARVSPRAEIEEARWIAPGEEHTLPLAPLSTEFLLPAAWAMTASPARRTDRPGRAPGVMRP